MMIVICDIAARFDKLFKSSQFTRTLLGNGNVSIIDFAIFFADNFFRKHKCKQSADFTEFSANNPSRKRKCKQSTDSAELTITVNFRFFA